MSDTPGREQKKAMRRAQKDRERAAADAALPLPKSDLAELFDHLDVELGEVGCYDTLALTTAFLAERELDVPRITSWLEESGGYCDCEVLANIEPEWEGRL